MNRAFRSATARSLGVPVGAAAALLWSNLAAESYFRITHALAFAVNDVGMALFFALLTQEVLEATMPGGALHTSRRAALPIVAAIGGAIGAIGAYNAFVLAGDEHVLLSGWPIVCAIDGGVAYFLVRVLIGSGGAASFVALMAIVSNAIGLIAISLHQHAGNMRPLGPLLIVVGLVVSVWLTRLTHRTIWPQVVIGGGLMWYGFWWSGLHPALALIPIVPCLPRSPRHQSPFSGELEHGAHDSPGHIEHALWMPVQLILFLFAFVNAGVVLHGVERGAWAVPVGALVGRPVGMLAAVGVSVALGLRLPHGVGWRELVVVALAVSCAFTFGLFFATAVFATGPVLMEAKMGALSTIVGGLVATAAALLLAVRPFRAARIS
jgi:Na+:H+ antiporter, NhaA family